MLGRKQAAPAAARRFVVSMEEEEEEVATYGFSASTAAACGMCADELDACVEGAWCGSGSEEEEEEEEAEEADDDEPLEPQLLRSVDALIASTSNSAARRRFLVEFRFRLEQELVSFCTLDDLHYALFEEWALLVRAAPWIAPHLALSRTGGGGGGGGGRAAKGGKEKKPRVPRRRREKVVCCHFVKSTETRPFLEAECRSTGVAYTPKTTRLGLAGLLHPDLPDFCAHHEAKRPATAKKRKREQEAAATGASSGGAAAADADEATIHMRGTLHEALGLPPTPTLRGTWSRVDDERAWAAIDDGPPGDWRFEYKAAKALVAGEPLDFAGFFNVDGVPIFESRLTLLVHKQGMVDAPTYTVEGAGQNQFGQFTMKGRSGPDGVLRLVRTYVPVAPLPSRRPHPPPPPPPPPPSGAASSAPPTF